MTDSAFTSTFASSSTSPFTHRGVVEGFYGPPWPHAERCALLERMPDWGMNTYVYAPKDDPLHRADWRIPYPEPARTELGALVEHGARHGVRVGFALAPGLSIAYASEADRATLLAKLGAFTALGAHFLCLALDDVPSELAHAGDRARFRSLADAHVDLANAVRAALPADTTLWLVPTDYAGTDVSPYLETLGAGLDPAIEVGWTGRSVVSPVIRAEEARARAQCLGRRLLVWDNYPVADGPMRNVLHLGPYVGREPGLAEHVSGLLLNPMELPRASTPALATAGAWMTAPGDYDPEAAWHAALREIGAGAPEAFTAFARAHRFSALAPDDRDAELEDAVRALETALAASTGRADRADAWDGRNGPPAGADRAAEATAEHTEKDAQDAIERLRTCLGVRAGAAEEIRAGLADRPLAAEIEPWLLAHATETRIMQEALDCLAVLVAGAPAMELALAFFRMEGRLTRIAPAARTSYGPRRLVQPQLVSLEDEAARFGDDPVLFLDHCLTEDVVRLAESAALARLGGHRARRDGG